MKLIGQELIKLANQSDIVKNYLDVPKDWKNIVKITPNSVHKYIGDGLYKAKFVGNRKYKGFITTNQYIRLIEEGAFEHCYKTLEKKYGQKVWDDYYAYQTIKGIKEKDLKTFAFDTAQFNPDANPESTSVDGFMQRTSVNETWINIRTGAGTTTNHTETFFQIIATSTGTNGQWGTLARSIFLFDTSSLDDGVTITDADIKLRGLAKINTLGGDCDIVSSNPASNTTLATTDYDYNDFGTTAFSSISFSSLSTSSYNTFTLDSNGIANISLDGISKFGARHSQDTDNDSTWVNSKTATIAFYSADNGSLEPTLDVTYTVGPSSLSSFNGVASASISSIDSTALASISSINSVS